MRILNLFNNKFTLPKLDESSAIYWKNDNRKKQLEKSVNFMHYLAKEYDLNNLPKELSTLINDLNFIYRNLYNYYLLNDKKKYENIINRFPELKPPEPPNFDRSAYLINEKRKELLKNLKNIPKKNKRKGIIEYLNEKYSKEFEKALKTFNENNDIEKIKANLHYQSFKVDYSFSNENLNSIKKLIRFIEREELPLISKIIQLNSTLDKYIKKELNDEIKNKINEIQELIKNIFINKYEGYNYEEILINQVNALKKNNLKEFSKWYNLEKNYFSNKEVNIKNIKLNFNISLLAKAASMILMFLSLNGKAYAENYINNNKQEINYGIVDENLNQNNNVNHFLINKNIELNNSIIIEKDIHQYIKKYCEERINFLEKIISERKSLINRVFFLRRYKNYNSEEIKRDIEYLKEMKTNPEEYINQVVDLIRETIKFLVDHYSSEEFIQRYSENALDWKVDDFKNKSSELGVPIDFTHEENFKKGLLLLHQRNLIYNLKRLKFEIISQETLNQLTTNGNDNFISLGGYLRSEHTIYIVPRDLNSIFETMLHESLHATYKGDRELTEKEKEILKKSFKLRRFIRNTYPVIGRASVYQDGKSEFLENYHKKPSERIVKKKMLDFELEKHGIKKYDEKFTKEHYTILLKLIKEGKLSKDATEFILSTTRRDLINIMNTIAYNDNDELNYA